MKRKEGPAPDAPTFESMMERLEQLVGTLESGNLSLEDSIHSFEEGMALVKRCTEVLDQAEQRIRVKGRPGAKLTEVDPSQTNELRFDPNAK